MRLTSKTRSIVAVSDADKTTTEPSFSVSYSDNLRYGDTPNGDLVGELEGDTPVTLVPAIDNDIRDRLVEQIVLLNRDTVSHTITVSKKDGSTSYAIAKATLGAGEALVYDGKGWDTFAATGERKVLNVTTP